MIVTGELKPGDRLPREADLSERLGLSLNSLREAVGRALTLVNVLDVRQADGINVTSLEPAATAMATDRMTDGDIRGSPCPARRTRR